MKLANFNFSMLDNCERGIFTFVNPYSYYILESSISKEILDDTFIFADGISLVYIHNVLSDTKINRYSFDFTSLAPIIFEYCIDKNYSIAIVGGGEGEIKNAVEVIKARFPKLNITFFSHGYVNISSGKIYSSLEASKPDVILSGMGTPLQEQFLLECKKRNLKFKFSFTCGGFISQISDKPDYFNPFLDRLHLRWLQRFIRHSYVRRRMLVDYPKFFLKYALSQARR